MASVIVQGTVIAERYRLERVLGEGGMGLVWQATHLLTRRSVAIKFIRSSLADRPEMKRRFLREARAATAVAHPNVVELIDVFELDDGTPAMVMELLRGETLREFMKTGPLMLNAAAAVFLPIVSAVGTAHARGIVHRDLKPENVFLCQTDYGSGVKVLDFGIAKFAARDEFDASDAPTTGGMFGTPGYMAPEQGFGEEGIDHLADVWSLGAMLYEALVGRRPIEGEHLGQVLKKLMVQGVEPIGAVLPNLPPDMSALVTRMLARDKQQRPTDLREAHRVLSRYTTTSAPSFPPPALTLAAEEDENQAARERSPALPDGGETITLPVGAATEGVASMTPRRPHRAEALVRTPPRRKVALALLGAAAVGGAIWRGTVERAPLKSVPSPASVESAGAGRTSLPAGEPSTSVPPPAPLHPPSAHPGSVASAPAITASGAPSTGPPVRRAAAAPQPHVPSVKIDRVNPY